MRAFLTMMSLPLVLGSALAGNPKEDLAKGDQLRKDGQYSLAILFYDRALKDGNWSNEERAETLALRADMFRALGKPDRADQDLAESLRLNPNNASVHNNRGVLFLDKREFEQAVSCFDAAIALKPDYGDAFYNRGVSRGALGQEEKGLDDLNQAIRLRPNYASAYAARGRLLADLQRYKEALVDLDKAILMAPDTAENWNYRGTVYAKTKKFDKAVDDYSKALELEREGTYYLNRIEANRERGRFRDVSRDFEEVLYYYPDDLDVNDCYACFLSTCPEEQYRHGDRAVRMAQKACKATQFRSPIYLETLAGAYAEKGDFESAVDYQQKAIELVRQHPDAHPDDIQEFELRLNQYQQKKPFRRPISEKSASADAKDKAASAP